jgi:hypothetical protein
LQASRDIVVYSQPRHRGTSGEVWVEKPFSAYRGDGPYVFVCYAHEDSEAVFREIAWLND